ncbi:MAG: Mur ligase family protein, partial [Candidatus Saccharimonadales bacterium]|nr:Mur ligase family protein [Candidatus Saccharimonadales bacterium]
MKYLYLFTPQYLVTLVYMLQASEYQLPKYFSWYWKTHDFAAVSVRRSLDFTAKAKLLVLSGLIFDALQLLLAIAIINAGFNNQELSHLILGVGLILIIPVITAHLMVVPLWIGTALIQRPKELSALAAGRRAFAEHQGVTIAVAGSYGKTTTKEVLKTIVGQNLKVAATEGNLNTPGALAKFGSSLDGDEDVVIVELGEFKPGDIAQYADLVQPNSAVITGLTEAHLDTLGNLETAAENLLSLAEYVPAKALFINNDSSKLISFIEDVEHIAYGKSGGLGWETTDIKTSLDGTSFLISKGRTKIKAKSQLLGEHIVATLVLGVIMAKELKVGKKTIEKGLSQTKPFDHRLQIARNDEITIIDDTYNGNIEGVKAASAFVDSLEASRKIYVTPGLVEMGDKSEDINNELGRTVAPVFDLVVLMKNPNTDAIVDGLHAAGYSGKLNIVD